MPKRNISPKWIGRNNIHPGGFIGNVVTDVALGAALGQKINLGSVARAAGSNAFYLVAPPVLAGAIMTKDIAVGLSGAAIAANKALDNRKYMRGQTGPTFGYQDTQQALTMRQAGIQAIQGSKMNARNSLGNEATMMHRPWSRS